MSDEDLATLQARYLEFKGEFERGEISEPEWRGARGVLEGRILEAGGSIPDRPSLDERLQVINERFQEKTLRTTRLYATEWLQEPETLSFLAEKFDAAEGDTATRLKVALAALRARVLAS